MRFPNRGRRSTRSNAGHFGAGEAVGAGGGSGVIVGEVAGGGGGGGALGGDEGHGDGLGCDDR